MGLFTLPSCGRKPEKKTGQEKKRSKTKGGITQLKGASHPSRSEVEDRTARRLEKKKKNHEKKRS